MRKILLLTLSLLALTVCRSAPKKSYPDCAVSSGCERIALDSNTLKNLEVLCRVWGFAKSHHPVFTTRAVDADYEFFALLQQAVHVDRDTRNLILHSWVDGLGTFRTDRAHYEKYFQDDRPHRMVTEAAWIADTTTLGPALSTLLSDLRYARRSGGNRYLPRANYIATNLDFRESEAAYESLTDPDCGYRLLSLVRYWNIIEYFFPNKHLTDQPWDAVLAEFLPVFADARTGLEYKEAASRLIAQIDDSHGVANTNYDLFGKRFAPFQAAFIEGRPIVLLASDTVPQGDKLTPGDEIVSVAGLLVSDYIAKTDCYVSVSNRDGLLRETVWSLARTPADTLEIVYLRDSVPHRVTYPTREEPLFPPDPAPWRMINEGIGYLYAQTYDPKEAKQMKQAFNRARAVIIDLRCYPTGLFRSLICNFFGPESVQSALSARPIRRLPGYFLLTVQKSGKGHKDCYSGRVIVLVNQESRSYAENMTMICQAMIPDVTVVGSQTAGADGDVSYVVLPGNMVTRFSGY